MYLPKSTVSKNHRRLIYGVGVNDADYVVQYKDTEGKQLRCPYYAVWVAMIERCYSEKLHIRRPSYRGCTVHPDWLIFSNFKTWMQQQDWKNKALDKDLLAPKMGHYGPDTCVFIPKELNNLLTLRDNDRGKYPIGVSRTVLNNCEYFVAQCSFYGKQKRLGYFKTVNEAANSYKTAKLSYIAELTSKETNPKIKAALLNIR